MKIIDLTHLLAEPTPVYPGDPPFVLKKVATIEGDGYSNSAIEMGMHSGTHIDGPLHMLRSTKSIDQLGLEKFIGQGVLIARPGATHVELDDEIRGLELENKIVLISTGFSQYYHSPFYFETHPTLTIQLAQFLADRKVKMVGIDFPSPDNAPYEVHNALLEYEIPIIENLTNLCSLSPQDRFDVIALPLHTQTDSAPARVVACVH